MHTYKNNFKFNVNKHAGSGKRYNAESCYCLTTRKECNTLNACKACNVL